MSREASAVSGDAEPAQFIEGRMERRPSRDDEAYASYPQQLRDADGKLLCVAHGCGKQLTGRQERWCSKQCVMDALATWDWGVCRKRILRRDKFTCQKCGLSGFMNDYDVDHITPLCEGGRLCDPSNLRTLCKRCHKEETRALAKRRAVRRRQQTPLPLLDGTCVLVTH